ncbi:MAG TPA: hypothetical protein VKX17_09380 [Planctomycetota bacterium]|nr:hypothetical protein [Planctomycetota bacterium]
MADEDDPFVYGEDGVPESVKALGHEYELTEEELHDVVLASIAANDFEAIALVSQLEEAGIPAMKSGGNMQLGVVTQAEVRVPRKLLEEAKTLIEKIRGEVSARGVEMAFKPENIEEQWSDSKPSPAMSLMRLLDTASGAERERILFDFVVQAIADSMPAPALARHLAAAGLSREEADALISHVKTEQMHLVREQLERQISAGYVLGGLGIAALVAAFIVVLFMRRGQLLIGLAAFGTITGFGLAGHAKAKLAALEK